MSDATVAWVDENAVYARVIMELRLEQGNVDEARLRGAIPAAAGLIDHYLDRTDPLPDDPTPAAIVDALVRVAVELYRRKDAGALGVLVGNIVDRYAAVDPLNEVWPMLQPWKQGYGIG